MRLALSTLILLHGLVHLMGFAKAFGYAELPQLTQPIVRPVGLLWLLGALGFVAAAALHLMRQESWWLLALPAIALSQLLVGLSWRDAKAGTLANLVILVPVLAAALEAGPASFRSRYRAAVAEGLSRNAGMPLVSEADLTPLPEPVRKYLRYTGAVGRPRVRSFRAVYEGRFRNGLGGRWLPFRSEQVNFCDQPTRIFRMRASLFGLPLEGLHLYRGATATMQIEAASFFRLVDARGPEMNQGETVTLFNDLCVMAPACLIDTERIRWQASAPREARASFTNQGVTIDAVLSFDEAGRLVNFASNDRFMSADGRTYTSYPWSTPIRGYRGVGGRQVAGSAELVWHMPDGEFCYGRFELVEIEYNLAAS